MIKDRHNWKIATDIHLHGSDPIELPAPPSIYFFKFVCSLGDLFDVTGCRKKDAAKVMRERDAFYHLLRKSNRVCQGNHELCCKVFDVNPPEYLKSKNILMAHGHTIKWDQNQLDSWYSQNPGRDCVSRFVSKMWTKYIRPLKRIKVSHEMMDRAIKIMDVYKCQTMICGHWHPPAPMVYKRGNYELYLLPRGINRVEVLEFEIGAINKDTGLRDTYYQISFINGVEPEIGELT